MTSPLQQKIKVTGPVVITANRTTDGVVIYRTQNAGWSLKIEDAAVVTTSDAALKLLGEANADGVYAIGAYIAPVARDGDRVLPGNLREKIRTQGPTFDLPA
jgi:predicted NAD/FAD-binding protein